MKRLVTLLVVVALAGSACAYGGTPVEPAALTVGSRSVSNATLRDELDFLAANPEAVQSLFQQQGAIEGEAPGSFAPSAAANLLNLHLQQMFLAAMLEDLDAEISEEARTAARDQVDQVFGGIEVPESIHTMLVELVAADSTLNEEVWATVEVPEEDLRAAFEATRGDATEVCVSHVLVGFTDDPNESRDPSFTPSEEQVAAATERIEAVQARLEAGEDFATVASEESDDPGSAARGGELGCGPASQYVEEFAEAAAEQEVGEVGEVVETMFGFHILRVDERTEPTFEELEEQLRQNVGGPLAQERFMELLESTNDRIDIRMDPRYGTVDEESIQVIPPEGAVDAPTLAGDDAVLPFDPSLLEG